MLRKFAHKGLEEVYVEGASKHINKRFHSVCKILLDLLDGATEPKDLIGVKDFHPLKGDRAGFYSMHVNGNWCITFRFDNEDVTDVDFEDYH